MQFVYSGLYIFIRNRMFGISILLEPFTKHLKKQQRLQKVIKLKALLRENRENISHCRFHNQ